MPVFKLGVATLIVMLGLSAAGASAEGKSYVALVGELIGIVEKPRYALVACARRFPEKQAEMEAAYEAWRVRHASVLSRYELQMERASARIAREAPKETLQKFQAAAYSVVDASLGARNGERARSYCDNYGALLNEKDSAMTDTVPKRLTVIENSDAELTRRESQL